VAPDQVDLRLRYGHILQFLGYLDEASAQYQAALTHDPTNIEAVYNLGDALREAAADRLRPGGPD